MDARENALQVMELELKRGQAELLERESRFVMAVSSGSVISGLASSRAQSADAVADRWYTSGGVATVGADAIHSRTYSPNM